MIEYLQNDDILIRLRNEKRDIDMQIKRLEARQDVLKDKMVKDYLEDGVLPDSEMIHIRKVPQSVIVTDESKVPEKFFKVKKELDKKSLNEAVKQGEQIDGVTLSNGGWTVAIRG